MSDAAAPSIARLGRETLIYGAGRLLGLGIGFLMVPIYTRLFAPWEYGVIEAVNVLAVLVGAVTGMGTNSALAYYFYQDDRAGAREVATAVVQWHLVWGLVMAALASALAPWVAAAVFGIALSWQVAAAAFAGALAGLLVTLVARLFQLMHRPLAYVTIGTLAAATGALLNLVFVLGLGWGVGGYFLGLLSGQLLALLALAPRLRDSLAPRRWCARLWPRLLRFGAPLVPATLATYLLNFADRWFIVHFLNAEALGLYALALKVALLVKIAVTVATTAFLPHSMRLIRAAERDAAERDLALLMRYYGGLFLGWALVVAAAAPLAVRLMAPPAYAGAAEVVGALTLPSVLFGATYFSALGTWRAERTYLYTLSVGLAVVVNLALNALLIPAWGILGAAVATAAAMAALATASFAFSQRLWPLGFDFVTAGAQLGVAATALVLLHWLPEARLAVLAVALALLAGLTLRRGDRATFAGARGAGA